MDTFDGYTAYAHNGGKYDLPMVMREALFAYKKFKILDSAIELNNAWIKMDITSVRTRQKICFKDSLRLFGPGSALGKLCKDLKVKHQKLTETVSHDEITIQNWTTFPALDNYLKNDCLGLLEVVDSFARSVWGRTQFSTYIKEKMGWIKKTGGINITDCNTGASLSKKTFFNCYYNAKLHPVYTMTDENDAFIRDYYFGGRVEIFKKIGVVTESSKFYYYDFTSLYPAMAKKDLPFGQPTVFNFTQDEQGFPRTLENKYFGFVKCLVRSVDFKRKPIHAVYKDNKLLFPYLENWREMVLFSEEIKLGMKENMYEYQTISGIFFNRAKFMAKFTDEMFKQKQDATRDGMKAYAKACKIILNSSYGFWGLRTRGRDSVVIGDKGDINIYEYLEKGQLKSHAEKEEYTLLRVEKDLNVKDFNVSVASAISSYARMELWTLLDSIEKVGKDIYMCDTDSVVCNCKLNDYPELMKKFMWDGCGEDLGSLKNECIDVLKDIPSLDMEKQLEADGGCPHFDQLCLAGCKFYSLKKTCINGEVADISKCKGYKQTKDDKLSFEIISSGETMIQEQLQFKLPKSNYVSETQSCAMRTIKMLKKFNWIYNKSKRDENNNLETLII